MLLCGLILCSAEHPHNPDRGEHRQHKPRLEIGEPDVIGPFVDVGGEMRLAVEAIRGFDALSINQDLCKVIHPASSSEIEHVHVQVAIGA